MFVVPACLLKFLCSILTKKVHILQADKLVSKQRSWMVEKLYDLRGLNPSSLKLNEVKTKQQSLIRDKKKYTGNTLAYLKKNIITEIIYFKRIYLYFQTLHIILIAIKRTCISSHLNLNSYFFLLQLAEL